MRYILPALIAATIITGTINAQSLETATYARDGGQIVGVPRTPNYIQSRYISNTTVSKTITVPSGVAAASPKQPAGRVDFNNDTGAACRICASSSTSNRCATATPIPTTDVSDGTAWDIMPNSYQLEPISGSAVISLSIACPVTNTTVTARFYKGK